VHQFIHGTFEEHPTNGMSPSTYILFISRIFMGVSHAIPIFHRRPPWRRRFKASNKLVHIVLRYTIGIHPVPIPGEHINDVLGISLCPTDCPHPQFGSNELGHCQEWNPANNHGGSPVQPSWSLFSGGQNLNLIQLLSTKPYNSGQIHLPLWRVSVGDTSRVVDWSTATVLL